MNRVALEVAFSRRVTERLAKYKGEPNTDLQQTQIKLDVQRVIGEVLSELPAEERQEAAEVIDALVRRVALVSTSGKTEPLSPVDKRAESFTEQMTGGGRWLSFTAEDQVVYLRAFDVVAFLLLKIGVEGGWVYQTEIHMRGGSRVLLTGDQTGVLFDALFASADGRVER